MHPILRKLIGLLTLVTLLVFGACSRDTNNSRTGTTTTDLQNNSASQVPENAAIQDPLADGFNLTLLTDQLLLLSTANPDSVDLDNLRIKDLTLYRLVKEYMQRWYFLTTNDFSVERFIDSFSWFAESSLNLPDGAVCQVPQGMLDWTAKNKQPAYIICKSPPEPLPSGCAVSPFCRATDKVCLLGCSSLDVAAFPLRQESTSLQLGGVAQPAPARPAYPQPIDPGRLPTTEDSCNRVSSRPVLPGGAVTREPDFTTNAYLGPICRTTPQFCDPHSCTDVVNGECQFNKVIPDFVPNRGNCVVSNQARLLGEVSPAPAMYCEQQATPCSDNIEKSNILGPTFQPIVPDKSRPILLRNNVQPATAQLAADRIGTARNAINPAPNGNASTANQVGSANNTNNSQNGTASTNSQNNSSNPTNNASNTGASGNTGSSNLGQCLQDPAHPSQCLPSSTTGSAGASGPTGSTVSSDPCVQIPGHCVGNSTNTSGTAGVPAASGASESGSGAVVCPGPNCPLAYPELWPNIYCNPVTNECVSSDGVNQGQSAASGTSNTGTVTITGNTSNTTNTSSGAGTSSGFISNQMSCCLGIPNHGDCHDTSYLRSVCGSVSNELPPGVNQ